MQFESFEDFLAMGGYGFYVWLSFGIAWLSLALLAAISRWERVQLFRSIEQEQLRKARISAARQRQQEAGLPVSKEEIR